MPQLKISSKAITGGKRTEPLWRGPCVDGVTQSLIGNYLVCPERFRIKTIEGWKTRDSFRHQLEYGNMWHICEESHAQFDHNEKSLAWQRLLCSYAEELCKRYPFQRKEVSKWYEVCKLQFPLYVKFWQNNDEVKARTPLYQEKEFKVPYKLPSGRTVIMRGKWDSLDLLSGNTKGLWHQENKTKTEVDQAQLTKQLSFDLQTMFYGVSLVEGIKQGYAPISLCKGHPFRGVRYNVIRRPLSGGKGSIKQGEKTLGSKCPSCKGVGNRQVRGVLENPCSKCRGKGRIGAKPAESDEAFYNRVAQYIKNAPKEYFFRWSVEITPKDLQVFQEQCLIPVLENLCDDFEWWSWCFAQKSRNVFDNELRLDRIRFPGHCHRHYRYPYGIFNPLCDGRTTELDEYLANGNTATLEQCKNLFPELKE